MKQTSRLARGDTMTLTFRNGVQLKVEVTELGFRPHIDVVLTKQHADQLYFDNVEFRTEAEH